MRWEYGHQGNRSQGYHDNEPYVVEGVWQKVEVEPMNVVLVNGEKRA